MACKSKLLVDSEVVDLYISGKNLKDIAQKFKCHTRTVVKILNKHGVKIRKIFHPKHTPESKAKLSLSLRGQKRSAEFCRRNGEIRRGKKFSEEHKKRISLSRIGKFVREKNPNWRGGVTTDKEKIRKSDRYKNWRTTVFIRDNFTCGECGIKDAPDLEVHHIKRFSDLLQEVVEYMPLFPVYDAAILYPPLWNLSNGITLCKNCHKKNRFIFKKHKEELT